MITLAERTYTFAEATGLESLRRNDGRAPTPRTIRNWATTGFFGVKLETLQRGGVTVISAEAIERFFQAVTRAKARAKRKARCAGAK